MPRHKQQSGFTLIELMIAVVVVATLAAIAYPSYVEHVRRGKVSEAVANLSLARSKFEQFSQDNRGSYIGYVVPPNCVPAITQARYFTYVCNVAANGYVITATGVAAQNMNGYVYTVNQSNARTTTLPNGTVWPCWVDKPGGVCF